MSTRPLPLCLLALLALAGCSRSTSTSPDVPAPVAGDQLALEILDAGPWQPGKIAHFAVRLQITRPGAEPELLLSRHVAEDVLPRVRVTYLRGTEEVPSESGPALERFC